MSISLSEYRERAAGDVSAWVWSLRQDELLKILDEAVTRLGVLEEKARKALAVPPVGHDKDADEDSSEIGCVCGANAYNRGVRNVQIALGKAVLAK